MLLLSLLLGCPTINTNDEKETDQDKVINATGVDEDAGLLNCTTHSTNEDCFQYCSDGRKLSIFLKCPTVEPYRLPARYR